MEIHTRYKDYTEQKVNSSTGEERVGFHWEATYELDFKIGQTSNQVKKGIDEGYCWSKKE